MYKIGSILALILVCYWSLRFRIRRLQQIQEKICKALAEAGYYIDGQFQ